MGLALVSVEQLSQSGGSPVIIIDARRRNEFSAGHITGAISLLWEDWCEAAPQKVSDILHQPGYWGRLDDPQSGAFAKRLSDLGLSNTTTIVVYADSRHSRGRDGRIAWMLLYLGAQNVHLLDGGIKAWIKAGGAIATDNAQAAPAENDRSCGFQISIQAARRATLAQLKQAFRKGQLPLLIDTRSQKEFQGDCYDYQPRRGHLPDARLIPFNNLFDREGRYVDKNSYLSLLKEVAQEKEIVSYCEVGVRASTFALLHEIYTGKIVPVYDGSIMEWSLDRELPIFAGADSDGGASQSESV